MNTQALFNRVIALTKDGSLRWSFASASQYDSFVFNPRTVFRAFQSQLEINDSSFRVLLVEKKYPDAEWDFEVEKYRAELHFIEGNNSVLTLADEDVGFGSFGSLISGVEMSTDSARKLLGL